MPKIIPSPVKRWPGTITIADPLTMPQYMAWMECNEQAQAVEGVQRKPSAFLPGILPLVEKWDLGGGFNCSPTVDTFTATPALSMIKLVSTLIGEIWDIVNAEDESPNE
jgi:hypothetical protein